MKTIWEEIGFTPSSFELPTSEKNDEEKDKPIADTGRFRRMDHSAPVTDTDRERYIGLSIANVNLDVGDDEIMKFVADYVSDDIKEETITIVREKKKAVVTINHSLTSEIIKEAMAKINFYDCQEKFFGKPLYCRPLRDITPDKPAAPRTPSSTSSSRSSGDTGTKSKEPCKKIPGLPPSAQSKALERQMARDKKEKKDKEKKQKLKQEADKKQVELESKTQQAKTSQNLSAFDVLMKAQKFQGEIYDTRDDLIPTQCSPAPWRSTFGQEFSDESRRSSFGSSPFLVKKRGAGELSSPSSPTQVSDIKKNKSEDKTLFTN